MNLGSFAFYGTVTVILTACLRVCVGVVRSLHALGRLKRVYCTETRPYNQGSRLTAYEAVAEGIPATLITDSMAALTMREMGITGVCASACVCLLYLSPYFFLVFFFCCCCCCR